MHVARRTDAVLLLVALVWGSSYLAAKTATVALSVTAVLISVYRPGTPAEPGEVARELLRRQQQRQQPGDLAAAHPARDGADRHPPTPPARSSTCSSPPGT